MNMQSRSAASVATLRALLGVVLLLAVLGVAGGDTARAHAGYEFYFDSEPVEEFRLAVAYMSDCDGTRLPPRCGTPNAKWTVANRPVTFCSVQANRAEWLTPETFATAIREAAANWNQVEAAMGIQYLGDCASGGRVAGSRRNEIAFDDERNVVVGSEAGVTLSSTSWSPPANPTVRNIDEADIVLADAFPTLQACLITVLTHELGHAIGLGHSADRADVMYPTFTPRIPGSCKTQPSSAEVAAIQELYGVDRAPIVRLTGPDMIIQPGAAAVLRVEASDPEGSVLRYEWTQLTGPPVVLRPDGPTASFDAPSTAGALSFGVTVTDRYLHPASATVSVAVGNATPATPVPPASTTHLASGTGLPSTDVGIFVFAGGTPAQLLAVSGCPMASAVFWATDASGAFVTFVPGTTVTAVNAGWFRLFPSVVPAGTALIGSCRR